MAMGTGAMHMGEAFGKMGAALQQALGAFGKTGPHRGTPTIRDLPLVIKALSFKDRAVAEEAHGVLVALCGQDLGYDPQPWQEWWQQRGQEMIRLEAQSKEAEEFFLKFKRDILTGQWERAGRSIAEEAMEEASLEGGGQLASRMRDSATALRKVYRDAKVSGVRLEPVGQATLEIEWGQLGFSFNEIPLLYGENGWEFARMPWDPDALV